MARFREGLASLLGLAVIGSLCVVIDDRVRDVLLRWLTRMAGAGRAPSLLGESLLDTVNALSASNTLFVIFAVVGTALMLLMLRS